MVSGSGTGFSDGFKIVLLKINLDRFQAEVVMGIEMYRICRNGSSMCMKIVLRIYIVDGCY